MKKYWVCIIEVDVKKRKLPVGFDNPPRRGAVDAVEKKFPVLNCWSGWGCTAKKFKEIMKVWNT